MWPIYTITGFDASAHTSEETVNAARNVPRGMLRSVAVSGLFGWVMVAAFVLAMPSVADGAQQGRQRLPLADDVGAARRGGQGAVGRDRAGQLPVRPGLRDLDVAHDVRLRARRRAAGLARAQARVAAMEDAGRRHLDDGRAGLRVDAVRAGLHDAHHRVRDLSVSVVRDAGGCRVFAPTAGAGRGWALSISAAGSIARWPPSRWRASCVLVWIGVQPPNEKALTVTLAAVALLAAAWWLGVRRRFRGTARHRTRRLKARH